MYILGSEDRIPSENVSCFFFNFPIRNVIDFQGLHARTVPIFMILEKRAVFDKFDKVWVYIPENS